jgi:hypothetical protein
LYKFSANYLFNPNNKYLSGCDFGAVITDFTNSFNCQLLSSCTGTNGWTMGANTIVCGVCGGTAVANGFNMCVAARNPTLYPNIAVGTNGILSCKNASTFNDVDILTESNLPTACKRTCAAGTFKVTVENMDSCVAVCP